MKPERLSKVLPPSDAELRRRAKLLASRYLSHLTPDQQSELDALTERLDAWLRSIRR